MTRLLSLMFALMLLSASCGNAGKKERDAELTDKKTELQNKKSEKAKLEAEIKTLELEIAKLDTGAGRVAKSKLVKYVPAVQENFSHYIDLQGRVDAENI